MCRQSPSRIVGGDALPAAKDQSVAFLCHKQVAVRWQSKPTDTAIVAHHVAIARHIYCSVNSNAGGHIETVLLYIGYLTVDQQFTVQCASHKTMAAIDADSPDDIVLVRQLMIGETSLEEAEEPLIGGQPESAPPVNKYILYQIESRGGFM